MLLCIAMYKVSLRFRTMVLRYILPLLRIDVNLPATRRFNMIRQHAVDVRVMVFFGPTTRGNLLRVHGGVGLPSASLFSFSFLSEHFYASRFGHAYRGISLYLEIVRIVAACLHKSSLLKYDIPWI